MFGRQRQSLHRVTELLVQVVGNRVDEPAGEWFDLNQGLLGGGMLDQREQHEPIGQSVRTRNLLDESPGIGHVIDRQWLGFSISVHRPIMSGA